MNLQDRLDRELLAVDQRIAKHTAVIDDNTTKRTTAEAERRAILAAYAALRGETP